MKKLISQLLEITRMQQNNGQISFEKEDVLVDKKSIRVYKNIDEVSDFIKLLLDNTRFANINISSSEYDTYQEDSFILGDATKEISLEEGIWYENYNSSLNETNNWLIRGGIGTTQYNGMFYYNATTDTPSEYITTRIVVK